MPPGPVDEALFKDDEDEDEDEEEEELLRVSGRLGENGTLEPDDVDDAAALLVVAAAALLDDVERASA